MDLYIISVLIQHKLNIFEFSNERSTQVIWIWSFAGSIQPNNNKQTLLNHSTDAL